jgi:type IV pilus assembly protein PilY1
VTGVTATTTVVTVTAANSFTAGDAVSVSGVTADLANSCTAADVTAINGGPFTVASATAGSFTYDATIPIATTGTGCTVTGATAGADYMFMGVNANPTELYSFILPASVLIAGTGNPPTTTATNTADIAGGTSAIIVDNDSTAGQASSVYFGTLAASPTICETAATIATSPVGARELAGTTVTITTTTAHGFGVGESVTIAGVGVAGYNGTWVITSVPTSTTFTYTAATSPLANSGGGTATASSFCAVKLTQGALQ